MKKIIIWGYCYQGILAMNYIEKHEGQHVYGFADNNPEKNSCYALGKKIMTIQDIAQLDINDFEIVIAIRTYRDIIEQLKEIGWSASRYYSKGVLLPVVKMRTFNDLDYSNNISLYAGDICDEFHMNQDNLYGLSINKSDEKHIFHDITLNYPISDETINSYEAEDVLEHISYELLPQTLNEIYRIIKKGACLRISLPDYNSPKLSDISMRDSDGNIVFDPSGGGDYDKGEVVKGGHVWFPTYDIVTELLSKTKFDKIDFICYFDEDKNLHKRDFTYDNGYINRIPAVGGDTNSIYSMLIDCYKS